MEVSSKISIIYVEDSGCTGCLRKIADTLVTEYLLLVREGYSISPIQHALERFVQVADSTGADMVYSDCIENGQKHPLIDCQAGSLRNDFDFGPATLWRSSSFREALAQQQADADWKFAALYDLRLRMKKIFHIREYLYSYAESDLRKSGERQFDYVKASARDVQVEMEKAVTLHLKRIGAYLPGPRPEAPEPECPESGCLKPGCTEYAETGKPYGFPVTVSVIIPVYNRVRTVGDAVKSALSQNCGFDFNVIVVDNHSTDGTTELLRRLSEEDSRLVHIIPQEEGLGIGGCWNVAIDSPLCGLYSVQLDSDDIYSGPDTLTKIVEGFRSMRCAMLVGAYSLTDFSLSPIPPGTIDHREWTDGNGHNNALRINGLGAPRAFRTDILRKIHFPNTSYGEDYAVALRLSGMYRLGRIYEPLYFCRRWDGNSDAALSIEKQNANNLYKDSIRTIELFERMKVASL